MDSEEKESWFRKREWKEEAEIPKEEVFRELMEEEEEEELMSDPFLKKEKQVKAGNPEKSEIAREVRQEEQKQSAEEIEFIDLDDL